MAIQQWRVLLWLRGQIICLSRLFLSTYFICQLGGFFFFLTVRKQFTRKLLLFKNRVEVAGSKQVIYSLCSVERSCLCLCFYVSSRGNLLGVVSIMFHFSCWLFMDLKISAAGFYVHILQTWNALSHWHFVGVYFPIGRYEIWNDIVNWKNYQRKPKETKIREYIWFSVVSDVLCSSRAMCRVRALAQQVVRVLPLSLSIDFSGLLDSSTNLYLFTYTHIYKCLS